MIDDGNSSTTLLGANETFTGKWYNVSGFNSISVDVIVDVAGSLYVDYSIDGLTTTRTLTLGANKIALGFHILIPVCKFFRVRLVNDGSAQGSLALQTIYSIYSRSSMATTIVNGGASGDNVVLTNNSEVDLNRGSFSGQVTVRVSGVNPSILANTTEKICFNGSMNWLTAATTFEVVSTSANDTAAGSGCRSVKISGLDQNWALANETVNTAGVSDSTATTTTFIRVFSAECVSNGTYGGTNDGDITIKTTADATHMVIGAGDGKAKLGGYTIPASKTGYIKRIAANVKYSTYCDIKMYIRNNANDVTTPFQGAFNIHEISGVSGYINQELSSYITLAGYTDVWFEGVNGLTSDTSVNVDADIILIND